MSSVEATWGADPLEYHGGFRALEYDPDARFRSSLAANGTVAWSLLKADAVESEGDFAKASIHATFPDIDWTFMQAVYGWAALQYQAWARGNITISGHEARIVLLYTDGVLEFWVDGKPYFGGDYYAYRRAPVVLHLDPGQHRLDLRLLRDVRIMGGVAEPAIRVDLELRASPGMLQWARGKALIPDIVDGRLAGLLGSLSVRNDGLRPISIVHVSSTDSSFSTSLLDGHTVTIEPGQTRPVAFKILLLRQNASFFSVQAVYTVSGEPVVYHSLRMRQKLRLCSMYNPHKTTFLHPGGIVSYAVLRPPSQNAACKHVSSGSIPVLLQLHGAGLEADGDLVSHSLDSLPDLCAFVLFPTGVTPWSGDDWHKWGFADAEAAIASVPSWMEATGWHGWGVNTNRWLVTGHSNGGQGTWYALTHRPDNIIAAAPVSGYLSIQNYVPYQFWQPMDPRRLSVVQASVNNYRHELMIGNAKNIPILQQHGSADDNVPAYHSRFMNLLIAQADSNSTYRELPGEGHWFDGVMATKSLSDFYADQLEHPVVDPEPRQDFSIVVADPGDMGSKGGVKVIQLEVPGQYGRVDVLFDHSTSSCVLKTSNVLAVEHPARICTTSLVIDGQELHPGDFYTSNAPAQLWRTGNGTWQFASEIEHPPSVRRGSQPGALDAMLGSKGLFVIAHYSEDTYRIALQVSRNLHQYFAADAVIQYAGTSTLHAGGNVITIAVGSQLPTSWAPDYPIQLLSSTKLSIRDSDARLRTYSADDGLAAIFLRPLQDERLELVIWGMDDSSLAVAARLMPVLTGVGQPGFVVLGKSCQWKGVEGALAMGFFDHSWRASKSSFFS
ncbi:hypothetical protein BJ546DRAFT_118621 [Cryomyces antarcticus]